MTCIIYVSTEARSMVGDHAVRSAHKVTPHCTTFPRVQLARESKVVSSRFEKVADIQVFLSCIDVFSLGVQGQRFGELTRKPGQERIVSKVMRHYSVMTPIPPMIAHGSPHHWGFHETFLETPGRYGRVGLACTSCGSSRCMYSFHVYLRNNNVV